MVEPSIAADGQTLVSVFQIGRTRTSGASAIGWGMSTDGGRSWEQGLLPHVTVNEPERGPSVRVSDPVVARDRANRQWIATYLALRPQTNGFRVDVASSHSGDGVSWSDPTVITKGFEYSADKDWVTCGNKACYAVWTLPGYPKSHMASATTTDGGKTWSAVHVLQQEGFGAQPVVRPDGTVTLVTLGEKRIEARTSTDGLRTLSPATELGPLRAEVVERLGAKIRSDVLPTAVVARDGKEYAAWRRCSDDRCSRNDIVIATSADGKAWSAPRLVDVGAALGKVDLFLPALAVGGSSDQVALTFLSVRPHRCKNLHCIVHAYGVRSADGGRTWGTVQPLSQEMRMSDFPTGTGGYSFLGDYMAVAFTSDGRAVATYPVAEPHAGLLRQGIAVASIAR